MVYKSKFLTMTADQITKPEAPATVQQKDCLISLVRNLLMNRIYGKERISRVDVIKPLTRGEIIPMIQAMNALYEDIKASGEKYLTHEQAVRYDTINDKSVTFSHSPSYEYLKEQEAKRWENHEILNPDAPATKPQQNYITGMVTDIIMGCSTTGTHFCGVSLIRIPNKEEANKMIKDLKVLSEEKNLYFADALMRLGDICNNSVKYTYYTQKSEITF